MGDASGTNRIGYAGTEELKKRQIVTLRLGAISPSDRVLLSFSQDMFGLLSCFPPCFSAYTTFPPAAFACLFF